MKSLPFTPKILSAAILTALLAACNSNKDDSPPAVSQSTISGTASKGTLRLANVIAYKVKDDGTKGDKIGETKTDQNGKYSLLITGYTGAVLLELISDANTKMLCDIAKGCGTGNAFGSEVATDLVLSSVLPSAGSNPQSAITPFTDIATKFARSKSGGYKKVNIDSAFSQVQQLFDLPDLQNTPLVDATQALPADLDAQRYALLNAAIGQLATNVADIQTKLDKLAEQIIANNGQLQSSEVGSANVTVDLADVLKAATEIANSNKLVGLNSLIKAATMQSLQEAQASTTNTNVQPTTGAGKDDLAKAKAFVSSVKQLVTNAQALQSLETSLKDKTKTVDSLTNGSASSMFNFGLTASVFILKEAVIAAEVDNGSTTLNATAMQQLSNTGAVNILNGATIVINKTNRTATMNGQLQVSRLGESPITLTVNNLQISYPVINTPTTNIELKISPSVSITSADLKLTIPAGSNSKLSFSSATAMTLKDLLNSENSDTPEPTVTTAGISLDKVTLEALKAPTAELSKFVGSINLNVSEKALVATTGGTRKVPMPNSISLLGVFSATNGDFVEAGLTIDTTGSNPKVSPEEGHVRNNLFNYTYNAGTAVLTANAGKFNAYWNPTNTLTITESDGCLFANDMYYLGCYDVNNVADGLVAARQDYWGYSSLMSYVKDEGDYLPQFANSFNFKTNTSVNGVLDYSDDVLVEDANNFLKGTISLNTKAKIGTQEASVNITAKRTAYGTVTNKGNDGNGEFMATIMVGTDKLTLTAPVVGGVAAYTLTNKDNVSVKASIIKNLNGDDKIEIQVGGKTAGWIYKINGLPVARFSDNSLMAL